MTESHWHDNDLLCHAVSYILIIHVLLKYFSYTHSGECYVFIKEVIGFMASIDVTGVDLFVMMVSDLHLELLHWINKNTNCVETNVESFSCMIHWKGRQCNSTHF